MGQDWDAKNRDHKKEKSRDYYASHKKQIAIKAAIWYEANRDKQLQHQKKNRKAITARQRLRKETDLDFKLRLNLRKRLGVLLRGGPRAGSAVNDCGISMEGLRKYLAIGFWPGMDWSMWNKKSCGFNLDHIMPLSEFDLTDRNQFLEANHYTNLQVLWKDDNGTKRNRLDWSPLESKHELPERFKRETRSSWFVILMQ
jgi:hypothetical protein